MCTARGPTRARPRSRPPSPQPLGAPEAGTGRAPDSGERPRVQGADLSPDGLLVAASVAWEGRGGGAIVVLSVEGQSPPRVIGRDSIGPSVRFSPDGRWIVTDGRSLSFWPVAGGQPVLTPLTLPYGASGLAWSPDGTRLALGNHYERIMAASTTVVEIPDPSSPASARFGNRQIDGGGPWFSADGQLHTAHVNRASSTGASEVLEPVASDTDATRSWVIGIEPRSGDFPGPTCWWSATGPAATAQPLSGLPARFIPLTW